MPTAGDARRGPLVGEIIALVLAVAADSVLTLRQTPAEGWPAAVVVALTPAMGPGAGLLAVLRRRFPARIGLLGGLVAAFSLLSTVFSGAATLAGVRVPGQPCVTETCALALLVGAGCRRLGRWPGTVLAVAGGVAMAAAPIARYGDSRWALFAAPTSLVWGAALGIGLLLRDADRRQAAELAAVRTAERLSLARDLHDLVTHYVTGIVVRAQAARVIAAAAGQHDGATAPGGTGTGTHTGTGAGTGSADTELYAEIEQAGADALRAMRQLVGMLRSEGAETVTSLREAVRRAVAGDPRVRVTLPEAPEEPAEPAGTDASPTAHAAPETSATLLDLDDLDDLHDLDDLARAPQLATTVHRLLLEALTNARRHAPDAAEVEVAVRTEHGGRGGAGWLVLEVVNDVGRPAPPDPHRRRGYGLVGMAERARALGGSVVAGRVPREDGAAAAGAPAACERWRVTARLPLA